MKKFALILFALFTVILSSCNDNNPISPDTGSTWTMNFTSDGNVYAASQQFDTDGEGFFDTPIEFVYNNGKLQYFNHRLRGQLVFDSENGTVDNALILDSTGVNTIGTFSGTMVGNNGSGTWQITSGISGSGNWTIVRQQ